MSALNLDSDAALIRDRLADPAAVLVACLCAEWCGTCRDYRTAFDAMADAHPDFCFVWLDVEANADDVDDFDVENFPTLLIEDALTIRFFGTVLPQPGIVERLLADDFRLPNGGASKLRPWLSR